MTGYPRNGASGPVEALSPELPEIKEKSGMESGPNRVNAPLGDLEPVIPRSRRNLSASGKVMIVLDNTGTKANKSGTASHCLAGLRQCLAVTGSV